MPRNLQKRDTELPQVIATRAKEAEFGRSFQHVNEASGAFVQEQNREYLQRRELAERAAAKNATSDAARRVHQELAQNYAELARGQQGPGEIRR